MEETERTKSSQPPSVSQQANPPAATISAAPAVVSSDTEPVAAGSTPNPPAIPKASTGVTVSTNGTSQLLDPGSEKRKRGRPKGSNKKVVAPVTNSLILPTSAPMGHSMLMGGWLGATMMGQEYDMAKKSKKSKTAANGAKDLHLVPMSLIVQPTQDITEELMRVARENDCSVCVLCAHGAVPGVTLKQCLTGVVTSTKGPMELMTLNGLVSPQRIVTGGFLNATLSTSGGMICGSVVGDFQALIHVHVVIGLLKPQAEVAVEPSPSTPAAAPADTILRPPATSSLPLA